MCFVSKHLCALVLALVLYQDSFGSSVMMFSPQVSLQEEQGLKAQLVLQTDMVMTLVWCVGLSLVL